MADPSEIAAALSYLHVDDRDEWVLAAMAVKSALGDSGFELWDQWSQAGESYRAGDAVAVWRSVDANGGITAATLFKRARDRGYRGTGSIEPPRLTDAERRERAASRAAREAARARSHQIASAKAESLIARSTLEVHDYLNHKGFPDEKGLVLDGHWLLVPMFYAKRLVGLQRIAPNGIKKFLSGQRAQGAYFQRGRGTTNIVVEGHATGLSVWAAFARLHLDISVFVAFSAGNMGPVAKALAGPVYLVADNDEKSAAGEIAAIRSGFPYWMPPVPGDANDFHRSHGIEALVQGLREMLNGA